jgi:hypothetical protein
MRLLRRCLALLLLLAMSVAETQALACPMGLVHHAASAEPDHSAHATPGSHDAHGINGPGHRAHDIPADPVDRGTPCAMSMVCAPAAVIVPTRLALVARQPEPMSADWPTIVHSSIDLTPQSPPPRLTA